MRYRQIHLDFHTSEKIGGVGSAFSAEQFKDALSISHADSITLFAKCHHGWSYHPTEVGATHPTLEFDLLGEQLRAAHELGIRTPVYLSAGWDERMAREHPEWLLHPDGGEVSFDSPGYHLLCMNTGYLDYLLRQIEEVVQRYECDGIFLDIVGVRVCKCRKCTEDMVRLGLDPARDDDVYAFADAVYANYTRRVRETLDRVCPGMPVFHNGGHITRGRRDFARMNSHLELESLPTGGWGYDHFPLSAAYAGGLGMEYLGMTGKFHTSWGEFGGFKHPNALIYETSLNAAFGAGSSVGDQLHPSGEANMATCQLIGEAYKILESKEPWLRKAVRVADVALLSAEAVSSYAGQPFGRRDGLIDVYDGDVDAGAVRILLEGKYLFDVVDAESELCGYKVVILPDNIRLDRGLAEKLREYIRGGGKVLATGASGLSAEEDCFALELGAVFKGRSEFSPVYAVPLFDVGYRQTEFVVYSPSFEIEASEGTQVVIEKENPYFNRTAEAFSSHMHTPNNPEEKFPFAVVSDGGAYIAGAMFYEYATQGSLIAKRLVTGVLDMLLGDSRTVTADLPAQGVVTLTHQEELRRYVLHGLYASPVKRGRGVEVIEDIVPLYNVEFKLKLMEAPRRVYSAPSMAEIPFEYSDGVLSFKAEKLDCHFIAVVEY